MIKTVINKINKSKLNIEPFPHFVIENLIPKKQLKELNKIIPNYEEINESEIYFQSKSKTKKTLLPSSNQYKLLCKNKAFKKINYLFKKIKPHVIQKFRVEIYKNVQKKYLNKKLKFHSTYNVMKSGYKKSAHLDRRDHLLHILYYPRTQISKGGDIKIYKLKKEKKIFDIFPNPKDLKLFKTYKIKDNFCIFTLNVPWSYHSASKYYGKNRKFFYAVYDFINKSNGIKLKNRQKGNNQNEFWNSKVLVYSNKRKKIFLTE